MTPPPVRFRIVDRSEAAVWCRDSAAPAVWLPPLQIHAREATMLRDTSEGAQDLGFFTGGRDG